MRGATSLIAGMLLLAFALACGGGSTVPRLPEAELSRRLAADGLPEGAPALLSRFEGMRDGKVVGTTYTAGQEEARLVRVPCDGCEWAGIPVAELMLGYGLHHREGYSSWEPELEPASRLIMVRIKLRGEGVSERARAHLYARYGAPSKRSSWDGWDRVIAYSPQGTGHGMVEEHCNIEFDHFFRPFTGSFAQFTGSSPPYTDKPDIDDDQHEAFVVAWSAAVQDALRGASPTDVRAYIAARDDLDARHRAMLQVELDKLFDAFEAER